MIRKAVGAIVKNGDMYLLVHKVKMMNGKDGPEKIKGRWDFPRGGVKKTDANLSKAILRELAEETGSNKYRIIKRFKDRIMFEFPKEVQKKLGFEKQEVTMFLVEYYGDRRDLRPQDEEIDEVTFKTKEEIEKDLIFKEPLEFFKGHV